jgi:hypothetical protein
VVVSIVEYVLLLLLSCRPPTMAPAGAGTEIVFDEVVGDREVPDHVKTVISLFATTSLVGPQAVVTWPTDSFALTTWAF